MYKQAQAEDKQPLIGGEDYESSIEQAPSNNINSNRSLLDSFKFNESNLESEKLSGSDLRKMILEYYGFKQLTEETLKLILKQGAEDNNLLRISEASYIKLVDALEIPLDSSGQQKTTELIRHVA